jgi:hypothetical protein
MNPEEIERVVGAITEKDVMSFAQRKLWDQDIAVSAVGSIEGLLDYQRYVHPDLFSLLQPYAFTLLKTSPINLELLIKTP